MPSRVTEFFQVLPALLFAMTLVSLFGPNLVTIAVAIGAVSCSPVARLARAEVIRARAGLRDVRIHDIRRSCASRALALGEGWPIIGRLLGHRRVETTARYAHLARDSVRESAERIAVSIAADAGARTVRTGARWQLGPDSVMGFEAIRQTSDIDEPDNQGMGRGALRF